MRRAHRQPATQRSVPGRSNGRGPAILSTRQQEVALLVAAGLMNREIGLTLHIGERTVETHVVAILRKLGLRRRTQIAAWFSSLATATGRTRRGQ